eukprot:3027886-Pyramimonas_sp.AAC.1
MQPVLHTAERFGCTNLSNQEFSKILFSPPCALKATLCLRAPLEAPAGADNASGREARNQRKS